jgi:hypothetical protein
MTHSKEQNKLTETAPEGSPGKDIKITAFNMLKELAENTKGNWGSDVWKTCHYRYRTYS